MQYPSKQALEDWKIKMHTLEILWGKNATRFNRYAEIPNSVSSFKLTQSESNHNAKFVESICILYYYLLKSLTADMTNKSSLEQAKTGKVYLHWIILCLCLSGMPTRQNQVVITWSQSGIHKSQPAFNLGVSRYKFPSSLKNVYFHFMFKAKFLTAFFCVLMLVAHFLLISQVFLTKKTQCRQT